MNLNHAMSIAAAGMQAESYRLRVVAENIANVDVVPKNPGEDPYRRKMVTFQNVMDKELGIETVKIGREMRDQSDFIRKYNPGHPYADEKGYITMPNVNSITELMDMREARRAYEANLNVVEASRSMMTRTVDLLR
jgi:flagellar basal-body rod protein FlgC